jgi:transcriptional regulator with XRE-family HTH domain
MTIGERVKAVRKELGLTLDKFVEKLGVTKSSLSMIENGKANPGDQTIILICREYNVNEEWLRKGTGEMFNASSGSQALDELRKEFNLDDFSVKLIKAFSELTDEQRASVKNLIENLGDIMEMGENEKAIEELETEYKKALGFAPSTNSSALNTTDEKEA